MPRRRLAGLAVLLGLALTLPLAAPAAAQSSAAASSGDRRVLQRYAADTWRWFELLLDPATGHPDLPGRRGVRGPLPLPGHADRAQLGR